jgi:hypothetical protein
MAGVSEQGARRYPRTFAGLIASMIVLVVAVVGFWALNNGFHQHPEGGPVAVDYHKTVGELQKAGAPLAVIYPSTLPSGWTATSADYTPQSGLGTQPSWSLGVVTAHHTFVGLRLAATSLDSLITTYVDKDAEKGSPTTVHTEFGDTWTTYTDRGGDTGYALTVGDDVLLVYGSADKADLTTFMQSLTSKRLAQS